MFNFIKKKKVVVSIIVVAVLIILVAVFKFHSNGEVETVSPVTGDLVRTVKVSGKVIPEESVELGFEISGTILSVSKEVGNVVRRGDVLARLDSSTISSEILKARAELSLAEASLDKLGGSNIYEAQIESAKRALIQTMLDAYAAAEDAVYNKTDQVFMNPRSGRPEISYAFDGYEDLRNSINKSRVTMGESLDLWKRSLADLSVSTYTEENLTSTRNYLSLVSSYINEVSQAVNLFETNSSLSETTLDKYKSDALSAKNNLNSSSQDLISTEDKLKTLLLEVPVQVARVESARATLLNYQSQLAKTSLTSPIDGIVARQEAKPGQAISLGTNLASVISQSLIIEAFVPEVLISGVKLNDPASVTLEAYGKKEVFKARITHIDPAETIRDGVSTYKIELAFDKADGRIRPGLTANISVETFRKEGVRLIPERAVSTEEDVSVVYLLARDSEKERLVIELGEKDSSGNVELLSDLPLDAQLIINPTAN